MMIYFLTYGDNNYNKSKQRISLEANDIGIFDKIIIKSPVDLPYDLPEMTKHLLKMTRGGGYWIWKPIIIKNQLDLINDNDILIYADAGCHINKNGIDRLNEYLSYLSNDKPMIRFQMNIPEYKYTTSAIFKHFNIDNDRNITETGQYMATSFIILKNKISMEIINKWYYTAIDKPLLFTDYYNNIEMHNEFCDNRHDQSIFSVITKIYKQYIYTLDDETNPYNIKYPICATRIRG
jgi:hypothetical protein